MLLFVEFLLSVGISLGRSVHVKNKSPKVKCKIFYVCYCTTRFTYYCLNPKGVCTDGTYHSSDRICIMYVLKGAEPNLIKYSGIPISYDQT